MRKGRPTRRASVLLLVGGYIGIWAATLFSAWAFPFEAVFDRTPEAILTVVAFVVSSAASAVVTFACLYGIRGPRSSSEVAVASDLSGIVRMMRLCLALSALGLGFVLFDKLVIQ